MKCWNYHQSERPDFTQLLTILERLPTKASRKTSSVTSYKYYDVDGSTAGSTLQVRTRGR